MRIDSATRRNLELTKSINTGTKNGSLLGTIDRTVTAAGTSDARFIKDYGRVVEFGLVGKSMHKIDEYSNNNDIIKLRDIYLDVLRNYFS